MQNELTADRLRQLVAYNPETGVFTWIAKRRKCRPGDVAGCLMGTGYRAIRLDNNLHYAHRLAWLYVTGQWPAQQIDHANGDRADNRFSNLREATNIENAHNRRKRKSNTSGYTGVRKENSRWAASIKVNYKAIRLGLFGTPEEAHQAYLSAQEKYHPFHKR